VVVNFPYGYKLTAIKKLFPTCHAEVCRDVVAAIAYCSKEETREEGPWTHGTPPAVRIKDNWTITVKRAKVMSEEEL